MTNTTSKATATILAAIVATAVMTLFAAPASAFSLFGGDGDSRTVTNTNNATVENDVRVTASTGSNDARGGDGARGGWGGDASRGTAGTGGAGGHGGHGGGILTEAAAAVGTVQNDINSNVTNVRGCGCEEQSYSIISNLFGGTDRETRIHNTNNATVENELEVDAETGLNEVDGGDADKGGNGGDANKSGSSNWLLTLLGIGNNSNNVGGHGAAGGNGGNGGSILSGAAVADGLVVNIVNRNVTRVTR